MKLKAKFFFLSFFLLSFLRAQTDTVLFELNSEFEYSWLYSSYDGIFDVENKPYLYTANNELGLIIFDVSNENNITAIDTIPNANFGNMNVATIEQQDNYIFVGLGNYLGAGNNVGLAIIDVSEPLDINIESTWDTIAYNHGNAIVKVEGDYAYIGAMDDGLIILDISNKSNIQFISQIQPDINFPSPPGVFSFPHGRGLAVKENYVFLSFDAGGLRVINTEDKYNPIEVDQYVNENIDNNAQPAYNNVIIDGDYAYVTVDYCGVEVLDISDPNSIEFVSWYNPTECSTVNWFGGEMHTNELAKVPDENLFFISGGDTELIALRLDEEQKFYEVGRYAQLQDSAVTWGMSLRDDKIALYFVDNSGLPQWSQPYYSDYGGVRLLTWEDLNTAVINVENNISKIAINPNPTLGVSTISFSLKESSEISFSIFNAVGQKIKGLNNKCFTKGENEQLINLESLASGLYFVVLESRVGVEVVSVVKE